MSKHGYGLDRIMSPIELQFFKRSWLVFCLLTLSWTGCAGQVGHPKTLAPGVAIKRAARAILPPGIRSRAPVLIQKGTLWTAKGDILPDTDLLIRDGKIVAIGRGLKAPHNAQVVAAGGRVVTPGLVDMHSHLGVYSSPYASAHSDGNEMSSPLTPMVRAVDSYDPEDPAIAKSLAGGVTTALILPGSGNVMGGEAAYVKLRGRTTAEQLLPAAPRAMKMAMGENPKRYYGKKGRMPRSRMGHAWLMRKQLQAAEKLRAKQDKWDQAGAGRGSRPMDRQLELLVALLKGEVYLQVHCYEVHDIETLLRVMNEFGVKVAAIHHALEAWKIPHLLKRNGVGVATFSDLWGFKMEAYDASVRGPSILDRAGVAVAIKSDHPVLPASTLMLEAAKAHHYGLPIQQALAAVTRIPAKLIGLGGRLGTLEVGKEGDVVIWDSAPLTTLGAKPTHVFVDGVLWVSPKVNKQRMLSGAPRPLVSSPCGCGMEAK
ncbi:MAG TPA: amidohydrolase [Myxococcales bacterium]|nr:amidohydrolase [Myxococcales bacterium]